VSAWRILVQNLYEHGRAAPLRDFDDWSLSESAVQSGLFFARCLGFIKSNGLRGKLALYELTPKGKDFAEGRVMVYAGRHPILAERIRSTNGANRHRCERPSSARRAKAGATWLMSYPGVM
jgi:hypothetical protein